MTLAIDYILNVTRVKSSFASVASPVSIQSKIYPDIDYNRTNIPPPYHLKSGLRELYYRIFHGFEYTHEHDMDAITIDFPGTHDISLYRLPGTAELFSAVVVHGRAGWDQLPSYWGMFHSVDELHPPVEDIGRLRVYFVQLCPSVKCQPNTTHMRDVFRRTMFWIECRRGKGWKTVMNVLPVFHTHRRPELPYQVWFNPYVTYGHKYVSLPPAFGWINKCFGIPGKLPIHVLPDETPFAAIMHNAHDGAWVAYTTAHEYHNFLSSIRIITDGPGYRSHLVQYGSYRDGTFHHDIWKEGRLRSDTKYKVGTIVVLPYQGILQPTNLDWIDAHALGTMEGSLLS